MLQKYSRLVQNQPLPPGEFEFSEFSEDEEYLNDAEKLSINMQEANKLLKLPDCFLINGKAGKEKIGYVENSILDKFESELNLLNDISRPEFNMEERISYMYKIKNLIKNCFENYNVKLKKSSDTLDSISTTIEKTFSEEIKSYKDKDLNYILDRLIKIKELKFKLEKTNLPAFTSLRNELVDTIKQKMARQICNYSEISKKFLIRPEF